MKLAVPLTAAGEAEILAAAGATEFYCGVQTSAWEKFFGNHDSISRRQGAANLSSAHELEKILFECKKINAEIFLTLNGTYTEEMFPFIFELVEIFENLGGSGVMTMDVALLTRLKKSRLAHGLSIMAAISSISALRFYEEFEISRVVFPRFLKISQMKKILRAFPKIQGEAVVWLDKCRFIDGYCRFLHSTGYADANAADCEKIIRTHDTQYKLPACFEIFGFPPSLPVCAVCDFSALRDAGVEIFKMGGRGRSLQTRLDGVKFLKNAAALKNNSERKNFYRETFGAECNPEICYYKGEKK
jgi:collagenase-like PrtC family protease